MLPLKDCRGYRSRYINALNRAVRALTPIAGRGIRLRQSAQGVVIESTAKGGGGGTVVPAVEPLRFLKVEYREISVGSSGSQMRWCVYLGKPVPYKWLQPTSGTAGAPWEYSTIQGNIESESNNDGWVAFATQEELNNATMGILVSLRVMLYEPGSTTPPKMDVVYADRQDYNPQWSPSVYVLSIPFAIVSGTGGAHILQQLRIGEVSLELVAANACNLLRKQASGDEWEEIVANTLIEDGDEFAIAQWWAIRAHFHDTAHDEHTADLSLRESKLAYSGTNCVSHSADHAGGLV